MDIWAADKLLLFIAFVVPGFISLKTYALLCPGAPKKSSEQLIDAVAYSSVNYALLLWPIYRVENSGIRTDNPTSYVLFYVFVLLVAPITWAAALKWLRGRRFIQRSMPHPTEKPWDYVFGRNQRYWIIVTLKDGQRIAGRYDSESFASSAPAAEQLYLQETWVLNDDGGFERPRRDSAGVLILAADIVTVELFNITRGTTNGERTRQRAQPRSHPEGVAAAKRV